MAASPTLRNAWSDFPEGAWVAFDWSERWGTNPATVEQRRTILTGHRSIGTSLTQTERQDADAWKRVMGGLHGAYPPDAEGMSLVSETNDNVVVAGASASCVRREYAHEESDRSSQRLILWHCDGVALAPRVLPQWSRSFGWQLAPDVARARIERRDAEGMVLSVDLELQETGEPLEVGGRSITCFRETLRWSQGSAGQSARTTTETTRWLSAEVPGLVAKRIDDNQIGRISTFRASGFGTKSD